MNDKPIEKQLEELGRILAPKESIVPQVMMAMDQVSFESKKQPQYGRWIMRISAGIAACLALVAGCFVLLSHPGASWAEVLDKVNQTHTLTFEIKGPEAMKVYLKGNLMRTEPGPNNVVIWNRDTGKMLMLDADKKQATLMTTDVQTFDFYGLLREYKDGKETHLPDQTLDGAKYEVFEITRKMPDDEGSAKIATTIKLWVDPVTHLPVRVEDNRDQQTVLEHLHFDADLPDQLFDMTVPAGYKSADLGGLTSSQLKPPPTTQEAETLVLSARGIGSLKFRDSKERIIAILGYPETNYNDIEWGYPSKGLSLLVHPKAGLLAITASSKRSAGPLFAMNDFKGKTDKGIGMGASRQQIEAAYGKADVATGVDENMTSLEYKKDKITFILMDNQLGRIWLNGQ